MYEWKAPRGDGRCLGGFNSILTAQRNAVWNAYMGGKKRARPVCKVSDDEIQKMWRSLKGAGWKIEKEKR